MRKNEDRMGAEFNQEAPIEQMVNTVTQEQPRQQLSFVVPTELVDLPSEGLVYPEGHPLYNVKSIEIRHMTAKEEDTLTSRSLLKKGVAIDKMLNDIIMDKNIKVDNMVIGDKNALVVAARITGYGADYQTKVSCPSCNKTQEFEFNLIEGQKVNSPLTKEELQTIGIKVTSLNTYVMTLWGGKAEVELKLLTGRDEAVLFDKMQKAQKTTGTAEASLTDQLKLMIRAVNGSTDVGIINQFVNSLPVAESRKIRNIYKKITPSLELINTFSCNFCDYETDMEVPFSQDFFWPKS